MPNLKLIQFVLDGLVYTFTGNSVKYVTEEEYDSLSEKDSLTNYVIVNEDKEIQYYYFNGDKYLPTPEDLTEIKEDILRIDEVSAAAFEDLNARLKKAGQQWFGTLDEYNDLNPEDNKTYFILAGEIDNPENPENPEDSEEYEWVG